MCRSVPETRLKTLSIFSTLAVEKVTSSPSDGENTNLWIVIGVVIPLVVVIVIISILYWKLCRTDKLEFQPDAMTSIQQRQKVKPHHCLTPRPTFFCQCLKLAPQSGLLYQSPGAKNSREGVGMSHYKNSLKFSNHLTAQKQQQTTATGFKIQSVQMKQTRCYMFNYEWYLFQLSAGKQISQNHWTTYFKHSSKLKGW